MKTLRLLAASLLIAVCAGFSSCSDDELEKEPIINFDPNGNNDSSNLEKTYSQYIDDYENMTVKDSMTMVILSNLQDLQPKGI